MSTLLPMCFFYANAWLKRGHLLIRRVANGNCESGE